MGKSCCEAKGAELAKMKESQKKVLIYVLFINAAMFFVEFIYGLIAGSTALKADSLDMLGDATVYAFSLYVLNKSIKWKAYAALLKGLIIVAFGVYVLYEAITKAISTEIPLAGTMGVVGIAALAANLVCLYLLTKHKDDDINMKSTWICSRNDIIANTGVIAAAVCVGYFNSRWPDVIIGLTIALVFLKSAVLVLGEAFSELKQSTISQV